MVFRLSGKPEKQIRRAGMMRGAWTERYFVITLTILVITQ